MLATAPQSFNSWVFDVSALMVLINDTEELKYRLSSRCIAEVLVAAPVAGIQTYLKSYEILLTQSQHTYFSPYGCKSAPLRNMKLDNYISKRSLLEDGKFTILRLKRTAAKDIRTNTWFAWTWLTATWLFSGLVMIVAVHTTKLTWIGIADFATLLTWSIFLRTTEYFFVKPASPKPISRPNNHDAAYILGRGNAGIVIEGSRDHIKEWTSNGLVYNQEGLVGTSQLWQGLTRVGTLLVMLFIFATIPNGSTVDQLAFILLNIIGQTNTAVGLWINANSCDRFFEVHSGHKSNAKSRTHVYAGILKRFRDIPHRSWIETSNLLPNTEVWKAWTARIIDGDETDAKDLYISILNEHDRKGV